MNGDYVLTCPSDLPLLTTEVVDSFIEYFVPDVMQSALAVVDEQTVRRIGIEPSYTREDGGRNWVLSGICIMNREGTLRGDYLEEYLFQTNWVELSVNMNTPRELDLARSYLSPPSPRSTTTGLPLPLWAKALSTAPSLLTTHRLSWTSWLTTSPASCWANL